MIFPACFQPLRVAEFRLNTSGKQLWFLQRVALSATRTLAGLKHTAFNNFQWNRTMSCTAQGSKSKWRVDAWDKWNNSDRWKPWARDVAKEKAEWKTQDWQWEKWGHEPWRVWNPIILKDWPRPDELWPKVAEKKQARIARNFNIRNGRLEKRLQNQKGMEKVGKHRRAAGWHMICKNLNACPIEI